MGCFTLLYLRQKKYLYAPVKSSNSNSGIAMCQQSREQYFWHRMGKMYKGLGVSHLMFVLWKFHIVMIQALWPLILFSVSIPRNVNRIYILILVCFRNWNVWCHETLKAGAEWEFISNIILTYIFFIYFQKNDLQQKK